MLVCDRCDCLIFGHTQARSALQKAETHPDRKMQQELALAEPVKQGPKKKPNAMKGDEEDPAEDPIGGSPGGVESVSAAVEGAAAGVG